MQQDDLADLADILGPFKPQTNRTKWRLLCGLYK